jgi:hypothetical protein
MENVHRLRGKFFIDGCLLRGGTVQGRTGTGSLWNTPSILADRLPARPGGVIFKGHGPATYRPYYVLSGSGRFYQAYASCFLTISFAGAARISSCLPCSVSRVPHC